MTPQADFPIFDGHNDVLHKIHDHPELDAASFFGDREKGHLDYPRALTGNFRGGLFAVYAPNPADVPPAKKRLVTSRNGYQVKIAPPLPFNYARETARAMIDLLHEMQAHAGGKFRIVTTSQELQECFQAGTMTAVLHMEVAEAISPALDELDEYYQRGLRSLGITWSRENAFGYGVPFKIPSSPDIGPGLKEPGKRLIKACNQLGIMIDLAHLNEQGFWDTAELSAAPLVSSHSAAHALIPRSRNLTDDQLRAIADSGGLVGVTFSVNDLDGGRRPKKDAPLSALVHHIRYISELIGVDHVGFGSDLDGTVIPSKVGNVTGFPKIIQALREEGFSPPELQKICHANWLRVLKATWH